ncbi:26112_t:CDS:2, partial [Gigaspora margarita]
DGNLTITSNTVESGRAVTSTTTDITTAAETLVISEARQRIIELEAENCDLKDKIQMLE